MANQVILLADDNPDDVILIKRALQRAGVLNSVQTVTGGEAVLCYLKGEGVYENRDQYPFPLLLLLDLRMPDRSGFEVLAWLKLHPVLRPKSVVVLTGVANLDEIRFGYESGADSFLVKPLVVEDLINVIRGLRAVRIETIDGTYRLYSLE
jgi:CheY-like chemotaxis protein